ncbi:MAG: O-antigen ligase domain-containing protein [Leptolyngbya sp. SIO3F4]|nr:O-antigen ligase domain-containing protein [Leptolyngbya sp. SIO3F4]
MVFLGAVLRRVIDYQAGYVTFGRWGLPSLLVICVSILTFLKYLPIAFRKGGAPFILSFVGISYALCTGIAYGRLNGKYPLIFLEWLGPLAFGFHLFMQWRDYPKIRQVIQKSFAWGTVVMGSYGIYQFCLMPPWDAFYMKQISAASFGAPIPFEVRVFGTQGAPQSFASIMMAGLILLLNSQGLAQIIGSGTGYLSFLLTRARSGWLGWCITMLTLVPSLSAKLQMRLVVTILIMALLIVPLINMEPFSQVISDRLDSFTNIQNIEDDKSFQDRSEGYDALFKVVVKEVVGKGLGAGLPGGTTIGGSDTSILPLLFSFGWLGTIPYLGGIVLIILQVFQNQLARSDAFASASKAISIGIFSQIGLNQIFRGELAILLWGFLGISVAACKYHLYQRSIQESYYQKLQLNNNISAPQVENST